MGSQECTLDPYDIDIDDILLEYKYNKLKDYLHENNIKTSNDVKRLNPSDYNKLKMGIPGIEQVGEERTELFIKKLDNIRQFDNTKYGKNVQLFIEIDEKKAIVKTIGKINNINNMIIDINIVKSNDNNEYLNIKQIRNDSTVSNEIFISKTEALKLYRILSNEYGKSKKGNESKEFNLLYEDFMEASLKNMILRNENKLLKTFGENFGTAIKLFINKIEALSTDGDIVKFLNNPSILEIKKEQYDLIHEYGYKTAVDIMNSYDKTNLSYTNIYDLKIGDKLNTMTLCALANNFNMMLGMYYNDIDDILILKSQTKGGIYKNEWISERSMIYYLQNESKENYKSLKFSHKPNRVCRDIILQINMHTKVYLFNRETKHSDYTYCGLVKPIRFYNDNKCIIITKE